MLTRERLMELLSYDPDTGVFRWRVSPRYRINTLEEARAAYKRAAREIYGEFARLD